jgi:hypothetical protein
LESTTKEEHGKKLGSCGEGATDED